MKDSDLKFLMKKIANSTEAEDIDAMHAVHCILYSNFYKFSPVISFFHNELNAKEKHRFFSIFASCQDVAILAGQILAFNCVMRSIKKNYWFISQRAFKKNTSVIFLLMGLFGLFVIWALPESFLVKTAVITIMFFGYIFYYVTKQRDLIAIEQRDIIIQEVRKNYITQNSEVLTNFLYKKGWLI